MAGPLKSIRLVIRDEKGTINAYAADMDTREDKRRPDGTLADGHRRLQCVRVNSGEGCPVPGSCSAAPIERALIAYCSDLVNLRALYRGDAATVPRAQLATATADLAKVDAQLQRLTDALLADDGPAPATFTRRARELELQRTAAAAAVQACERAVADAARANLDGADERWRTLAAGVEALDHQARMQARQLVVDTFERLVVYRRGARALDEPRGAIDVLLVARGGTARMLSIDKSGAWLAAEDLSA